MNQRWGQVRAESIAACGGDLRAIACYAALTIWRNKHSDECWPTRSQLALLLGVSEATVWRGIQTLVEKKVVAKRPLLVNNAKVGNVYTLLSTGSRESAKARRESALSTRARDHFLRKEEQLTMNRQEKEVSAKSSLASVTPIDGRLLDHPSTADQLIAFWVEVMGLSGRHRVTLKRERMVRARLENYEPDDVADALRGLAASEWHRARGYTEFERVLGSDEALELWRDRWRGRAAAMEAQLATDPAIEQMQRIRKLEGRA